MLFSFFVCVLNLLSPNNKKNSLPLFFISAALASASAYHKISRVPPQLLCTLLSAAEKMFCMFPHSLSNTHLMGYVFTRVRWKHRHSSVKHRLYVICCWPCQWGSGAIPIVLCVLHAGFTPAWSRQKFYVHTLAQCLITHLRLRWLVAFGLVFFLSQPANI